MQVSVGQVTHRPTGGGGQGQESSGSSIRNPHREIHEILEHEDGEVWASGPLLSRQTVWAEQVTLPPWQADCLIDPTGHHSPHRHHIHHGEKANLDHQLLKPVYLGPAPLLLDHCPV